MNNILIFLRHAETRKDENAPVSQWLLSEEGTKSAEDLAKTGIFDDVDVIITSAEQKAVMTAKPIADRINKRVIQIAEINELDRDKGVVMTKEEYEKMKTKLFEDLDYTAHGWETANHALNRFKQAVSKIEQEYDNKKILVVTHGTVMTLYFAFLQKEMENLLARWKKLNFCGWGIVKNNAVVKDIV